MPVIPTANILSLKRQPSGDFWLYTMRLILPASNDFINLPGLPNILSASVDSDNAAVTGLGATLNIQGATASFGSLTFAQTAGGADLPIFATAVGR